MCTQAEYGPARLRQAGVTLIELIIFIVIVSVGIAGVLSALNVAVRGSADPLQPKQALAIAEALLEEILFKHYANPGGGYSGSDRTQFDDIGDFSGYSTSPVTGYTATVAVAAENSTDLPGMASRKITVTVTQPGNQTLVVSGYRANY